MRVIKKLNNNAVICVDNNGNQLIALGNGIGFPKTPYTLNDLSKIRKTFYGVNAKYYGLLNEIPDVIFTISAKLVDVAKTKIARELNPNIVFTLADHIKFAYDRYQKGMTVQVPYSYDFTHQYETEMAIGEWGRNYINEQLHIHLDKQEAVSIALHFVNSQYFSKEDSIDESDVLDKVTAIIEERFSITIDRKGFNYSRFTSHMQFLLRRQKDQMMITSENQTMFSSICQEYPTTYDCVKQIDGFLQQNMGWGLSEEEQLYLILHINRLRSRESIAS